MLSQKVKLSGTRCSPSLVIMAWSYPNTLAGQYKLNIASSKWLLCMFLARPHFIGYFKATVKWIFHLILG